ncbi:MAG: hypothetical protein ACOH13_00550 [Flavobacteriales bacterium]
MVVMEHITQNANGILGNVTSSTASAPADQKTGYDKAREAGSVLFANQAQAYAIDKGVDWLGGRYGLAAISMNLVKTGVGDVLLDPVATGLGASFQEFSYTTAGGSRKTIDDVRQANPDLIQQYLGPAPMLR